jgi:hypothetical protein
LGDQRFVVIKINPSTVNLAKLGGGEVPWRVSPRVCTPVPIENL